MNYWLHRISHHAEVSYPLIEKGILSVGWSELSDENFLDQCAGNWENLDKAYKARGWDLSRSRYSLMRFIFDMRKDDFVLVPSWGKFSIYKILDDKAFSIEKLDTTDLKDWNENIIFKSNGYLYKKDESTEDNLVDLGFFHKVEPIVKEVPRNEYADQALTSRMKIRQTNADINDLKDSILKSIRSFEAKEPINLHSLILENATNNVLELIHKQLDPDKFESLIKWYFERTGASNVIIPPKNERDKKGDADIVATYEPIRTIIYVQAKKYVGETDSWAFEQINEYKKFKESMDDGYSKIGWVISTADKFSDDCMEAAQEAHILLINGRQFSTMLLEAGISNLNSAFN
jgi:restriction endonuclease Mrr